MKIFLLILLLKLWQEVQPSCVVEEQKSSIQQLYTQKCNIFGCKNKYYYPTLYFYAICSSMRSLDNSSLSTSQDLKYIKFKDSTIQVIPTRTFSQVKSVSEIYLDNSKIETIEQKAFNGLNTLKKLDLSGNNIQMITRATVNPLPNLEFLDYSYNNIQHIDNNAFNGILSLKTLILTHNNIINIGSKTFATLSSLNGIRLDYNNITEIYRYAFDDVVNITYLHMSNNNLQSLPVRLFRFTTKLQDIELPNNRIQEFDFHDDLPPNLMKINLRNNSISLIKNWIKLKCGDKVDLSYNNIFKIEPIGSSGLRSLTLESNKLRSLGSALFNNSRDLTTLNFAKNAIASIQTNTFIGLFNLNSLNLSYNELSYLPIGAFQNLNSLEILDLSNNNIQLLEFGTFGGLNNLQKLWLNENKLKDFPEHSFHVFEKLKVLYLNNNLLEKLNASLLSQELTALSSIWLDSNDWICGDLVFIKNEFEKNRVSFQAGNTFNMYNVDGVACRHDQFDQGIHAKETTIAEDLTKSYAHSNDFMTTTSTSVELKSYADEKKEELERTSRYIDELFMNSTFYNFFNTKFQNLSFFQYFNNFQNLNFFKNLDDGFKNSSLYKVLNKNLTFYNIGEGNFSNFVDREINKSKLVSYFDRDFFNSSLFKYFDQDFIHSEFFIELNKSRSENPDDKEIMKKYAARLVDENHENLDFNSLRNQVTLFMCLTVGLLTTLVLIFLIALYKLSAFMKTLDVNFRDKHTDLELML